MWQDNWTLSPDIDTTWLIQLMKLIASRHGKANFRHSKYYRELHIKNKTSLKQNCVIITRKASLVGNPAPTSIAVH